MSEHPKFGPFNYVKIATKLGKWLYRDQNLTSVEGD